MLEILFMLSKKPFPPPLFSLLGDDGLDFLHDARRTEGPVSRKGASSDEDFLALARGFRI